MSNDMTTRKQMIIGGLAAISFPFISKSQPIKSSIAINRYGVTQTNVLGADLYIQDDLIAMWDGIENVGWGIHDKYSSKWVDLVGGNVISQFKPGVKFSKNALYVPAGIERAAKADFDYPYLGNKNPTTCECVIRCKHGNAITIMQFNNRYCWFGIRANGTFNFSIGASCGIANESNDEFTTFSGTLASNAPSTDWKCYRNSELTFYNRVGMSWGDFGPYINAVAYTPINEEYIASIRLYSRDLTADEIAYNYSIDKMRFGI